MHKMTVYVPMLYASENGGEAKALLAIHKTNAELPMTETTSYSLLVSGEKFFFKPIRMLNSFEWREAAVVLAFASGKRISKKRASKMSERFFEAARKDSEWEIFHLEAKNLSFFIHTIAVPASLRLGSNL